MHTFLCLFGLVCPISNLVVVLVWVLNKCLSNIDRIPSNEDLIDKRQYFALHTKVMLIIFFRDILLELCTIFDLVIFLCG